MNKTFKNKNGVPIIRKCNNCLNFKAIDNNESVGYCRAMQLYFAFTHDKSVYAIVKDFYICPSHQFLNEELLKAESEEIDLLPFLLDRNAKKKL
jgi:hypothetical protein